MFSISRRRLLGSSIASAAVATAYDASAGYLTRHPGSAVSSIIIQNTSTSASPANSVTQLIGCPFRKGDIAKGTWPQFQLADGTNVPCTILEKLATSWSDGSLKFVPVMLSIPESIPGKGSATVNILSGGQMPSPSPRKLSDFHKGIDPQVQVDGLDNLSGTWVMDLKKAISAKTQVVSYGNGAAGAVWKVRANAQQRGANHGQLVCDFYIASLANPDGSLKGLRILGKVKLPYYDATGTMNWMSFSRFQLCLNAQGSLIRDCFGNNFGAGRAYNFSWNYGATFNANSGYSTNAGGDYAYCTRLTTTGTLPSGLATNTSYFTGAVTSTTIGFGTNACAPTNTLISASDGGSGTHTATPYPYLSYFGALFTAGPSGMWDFVQGTGSDSADTPLRFQVNQSYWMLTQLLPSYDLSVAAASNAPATYWPNCSGPVTRYLETTGDRDDLGVLPSWYVRHFLTQASVDEQVVRVVSLIGGHGFAVGLESATTLTYPCVNNGMHGDGTPYPGMPAPNASFNWYPGVESNGFTNTTNPMVQLAGFSAQDTSHMPQFNYYPYLLTGEPWHLDMLLEHANSAVYQRCWIEGQAVISKTCFELSQNANGGGNRILQVGTNPWRYGITIGNPSQVRTDAWATALLAAAAGIAPDNDPYCGSYKKYFKHMNHDTWNAAIDILNALPNFAAQTGLWCVPYSTPVYFNDHWQIAYMGSAVALAANMSENTKAITALDALTQYFDYVIATYGGWHAGCYMTVFKTGSQTGSPIVTNQNQIAFYGPNFTWNAGGQFALTPFSNYTPNNGDIVIFADSTDGTPFVTPAGFSMYTPYYMVNLNGNNFGLSTQPGGSPQALTDSYSGGDSFYIVSTNPPSTGSMAAIGAASSYNSEILGMLSYAYATGAAVQSGSLSDLAYRNQQANTDYTDDPKWAMTTTFVQSGKKHHHRHQAVQQQPVRAGLPHGSQPKTKNPPSRPAPLPGFWGQLSALQSNLARW